MKHLLKITFSSLVFVSSVVGAQEPAPVPMQVPQVVPVPSLHPAAPAKEPTEPPARDVSDQRSHLTFHLPAGWNLTRRDSEISNFHLDARTAPARSQFHLAASLAFNPYPLSTFAGSLLYISSTPHMTGMECTAETTSKPSLSLNPTLIGGLSFARGKDEFGHICIETRDLAYTALRNNSCLRIDLVIHTFCGGEVSGADDLTAEQLQSLYTRSVTILESIHFTR